MTHSPQSLRGLDPACAAAILRPDALAAWMERTNPGCDAATYLHRVQTAYRQSQLALHIDLPRYLIPRLPMCRSYEDFTTALMKTLPAGRVLIVGCGAGIPGLPSAFAAREWRCLSPSAAITQVDLSTSTPFLAQLPEGAPFDVVVTYSIALHLAPLAAFFAFVSACTRKDGWYVFGHEPNARFWRNVECQGALLALRQARRKRNRVSRYVSPGTWLSAIRARLSPQCVEPSLVQCVNEFLQRRYGFVAPLSEVELIHLVDLHRPQEAPGWQCLGWSGFDVTAVVANWLHSFEEVWRGTSGHLGYTPRQLLPSVWKHLDCELARRFPGDGATMSVCLRKLA